MWYTTNSEHSTSSQEREEESWQTFCLDTYLSELARSRTTQGRSCSKDSETESCQSFQSGMTSARLMGSHGEDLSMSSQEDFRARTLASVVRELELKEKEADYGEKCLGSFAKFDHNTLSWRTHQCLLLGGLEEFSETWPQWGIMQDGECWELTTVGDFIDGRESGLWPTTTANMWKGIDRKRVSSGKHRFNLKDYVPFKLCIEKKPKENLNPEWTEYLMMWPIGHTDLKPLEMGRFHKWLHSHGKS